MAGRELEGDDLHGSRGVVLLRRSQILSVVGVTPRGGTIALTLTDALYQFNLVHLFYVERNENYGILRSSPFYMINDAN
jgi:hypothetical protein